MLLAAAVGAVLILVLLAVIVRLEDGDTDTRTASSTSSTASSPGADTGSANPGDSQAPDAPATDPAVPIEPVQGTTGAELCSAAVERVQLYRDAAEETPVPDEVLAEQLAEFEAQIDTQADDQGWGDRIIEDLTGVRREWVTARSAASDGDDEKAQAHGRAAVDLLDHIVDRADCPTA